MSQPRCCIAGCPALVLKPSQGTGQERLCRDHLALAPPRTRERMLRAQIRLIHLEAKFQDEAYFEDLVASGRYLRFCALLGYATDVCALTWERTKHEIEAEVARRAMTGSPGDLPPPRAHPPLPASLGPA